MSGNTYRASPFTSSLGQSGHVMYTSLLASHLEYIVDWRGGAGPAFGRGNRDPIAARRKLTKFVFGSDLARVEFGHHGGTGRTIGNHVHHDGPATGPLHQRNRDPNRLTWQV